MGESMGSNNYAEVITDPIKAREVLSQLEKLAGEGWAFSPSPSCSMWSQPSHQSRSKA
jgi:hypothetical protein